MRIKKYRAWSPILKKYLDQEYVEITPISELSRERNPSIDRKYEEYIGKNDINGKEIYEGDILKINNPTFLGFVVQVVFSEGQYLGIGEGLIISLWNENNQIEVIGNINENPDLIKN